ncbi:MAG: cysteine--tRNA ligase [Alphaproteobacteria bacterium]|nr:cysteine--tRNA ligase [Alphaproteobacteria bacterium]
MKTIKLYNSLSNSLEDFVPIDPENVRMYACGPTVYASPHIGNARPIVVFDVLFRLLNVIYNNKVTFVRNITDVDDKINNKAHELGISIRELTNKVIDEFHSNIAKLNVCRTTYEPRATDHIQEMLDIIQILIDKGYAYEAEGHVLFRVKKLQQYGILSKRDIDEMIAGSRIEIAPYKEDPMDFVLWKPSEKGMPAWNSKYSSGRPGWHIECSAMSAKYLGKQFDIHAGGQDLMFPHHENEIAQNYGAFGCLMANYWLHNGMLLIDGQKMSKSLGNIISLEYILKTLNGEVIRYVLLSSHYQKTLNWTDQAVHQAKQALNRLYGALKKCEKYIKRYSENSDDYKNYKYNESNVIDALCNNLNTPLALTYLHKIADQIYKIDDDNKNNINNDNDIEIRKLYTKLKTEASYLGLLNKNVSDWFKQYPNSVSSKEIEKLIEERATAKKQKDFQKADNIRSQLLEMGIQIEDTKFGTTWKTI